MRRVWGVTCNFTWRSLSSQEREASSRLFKGKEGEQLVHEIGKRTKTFVPGAPVGERAAGAAAPAASASAKQNIDAIKVTAHSISTRDRNRFEILAVFSIRLPEYETSSMRTAFRFRCRQSNTKYGGKDQKFARFVVLFHCYMMYLFVRSSFRFKTVFGDDFVVVLLAKLESVWRSASVNWFPVHYL